MDNISIIEADLKIKEHSDAVILLTKEFSNDHENKTQESFTIKNLIKGLRNHPTTIIFIAYKNNYPIGQAICFKGFSTFNAKPLINIHDLYVNKNHRGKGVGSQLINRIEKKAKLLDCCKITLEVVENNLQALKTYDKNGFKYITNSNGKTRKLFLSKKI